MANIKNSFAKGITAINVKTNNFMQQSKCKTYIITLSTQVKELKTHLGEKVYENHKNQTDPFDGTDKILNEIDMKMKEIQEQERIIKNLEEEERQILGTATNGVVYCSQCGASNDSNYKFCCKCGTPLK